jgi:hypothetical protein
LDKFDPHNGQKLSGQLWDYMVKAALAQTRVVLGKAEFEIEQRSFGNRKTHVCPIEKLSDFCYFFKTMFSQVGD